MCGVSSAPFNNPQCAQEQWQILICRDFSLAADKPFPFSQFQSTYSDSCHKAVPRYPRIDYIYKFCDKSRIKEAAYNKRCHLAASRNHHRHNSHQPHYHQNSLVDHHQFRAIELPIASLESENSPQDKVWMSNMTAVYATPTYYILLKPFVDIRTG